MAMFQISLEKNVTRMINFGTDLLIQFKKVTDYKNVLFLQVYQSRNIFCNYIYQFKLFIINWDEILKT